MSIQQLRQLFAMESQDTLQQMEDALLHLETNPGDREAVNVLFRTAHTIKGSAGVVGLEEISSFTHAMENVLEKVRGGQMAVTPEFVQFMLGCRDHVEKMLEEAIEHPDSPDPELTEIRQGLIAQLQTYLSRNTPAPPPSAESASEQEIASAAPSPAGNAEPESARETRTQEEKNARLRQIFIQEMRDTLEQQQQALETLEHDPEEHSALESLFRCFHTLRGSAGLVGFQALVEFSHGMENNLLDCQRKTERALSGNFLRLMREGHVHLKKLLEVFSNHGPEVGDPLREQGRELLQQLASSCPDRQAAEKSGEQPSAQANDKDSEHIPAPEKPPVTVLNESLSSDDNWHISIRFHRDALRQGVDPLASLRYLAGAGRIVSLHTLFDPMPPIEEMDAESCYLGFELEYESEANKEDIENMFELVREHCRLHILPPHSQLSRYIRLIQELPEDTLRLGEILIESGTLTERELQEGLNLQLSRRQRQDEENREFCPLDGEEPRIGQILVNTGVVQEEVVEAALRKQRLMQDSKSHLQRTIQVDADKLDQLINLVGELVIANAGINLLMQEVNNDRLKESVSTMSRLVEDIRNSTLRMRMVHIGGTFTRFRRLVHDISHDLGKKIELQISGSDTELDKSMVEKINDPLMHLVRNAIDHGIESEEERRARGKSLAGTVYLNAYHDSGGIVIEVSDDGAGLDRERIRQAAIEKGILKPDQDVSEQELDNLIFEPALSTAREVTQLSGRGVGLDVVKRNIGALNGAVDIKTVPGEGTTVQIFMPLTLAIIDGFLLTVGGSSFVIPLDRVVECVEFNSDKSHAMQTGYLNLRGKVLPLLSLRQLFRMKPDQDQEQTRENIVVVHYGNQEAGLVVDELQGEFQAVIKPLGKVFERLPGVSGATILGNGSVALILDVPALVKKYALQDMKKQQRKTAGKTEMIPA